MPFDRSARLDALARHLPFGVDDFDAARDTFVTWRRTGAEADRQTAQLWAYCYVVWYFYGKFARERTGGPSDLDGVIERACRRTFRSMESVRDPERFPQFVSVVCRNVLLSYRARRRPTVEMDDHLVPVAASEADGLDRVLVRRLIVRAIGALPPAISEVARMRLLEGRSYQDVAQATGHPLATTRTYYSKALARLRADPDLRALHPDGPLVGADDDSSKAETGGVRSARP
ncbi:RNA polymerase sigma factor [Rubrivirga sp.]|uniref:RNA polymerase sigma factor n=1 Tax=Rubrivirga sp. TaxID=1885344 RepID=UPI003B51C52B